MEYSSIFYQISIVLCKPVDYQQSPRSCCNRPTRSGSSSLCIGKCLMQSAQLVIYNLSLSPRLRNISPPSYRSSHYFLWQRDTQKYSELFFFLEIMIFIWCRIGTLLVLFTNQRISLVCWAQLESHHAIYHFCYIKKKNSTPVFYCTIQVQTWSIGWQAVNRLAYLKD